MHVVTIIHYQSVTELGLVFHNSYSNFTNFPSIFSPLLNVSVSANKIEVCAKISIIDIRRFIVQYYTPPILNVYKQKTPLKGGA